MLDNISIGWGWMLVGFVIGVACCYFVCDLIFPVKKK